MLLSEATVDCYGEDQEFMGMLYTLDKHLNFPLNARALGEPAEVVGLDDHHSSLQRSIIARVCNGDKGYGVALAELEFVDPDPVSAERLEMYRYWLGLR